VLFAIGPVNEWINLPATRQGLHNPLDTLPLGFPCSGPGQADAITHRQDGICCMVDLII